MSTRPRGVTAEARRTVTGAVTYTLPLGFTSPPLSLNHRHHYRVKGRLAAQIKTAVVVRARQLHMRPVPHLHVELHYVPADRRARDADNLVATLKPAIDALTAAGKSRGRICAGIVPDDTPEHVSWSPPTIHEPDEHGPRLWLEVTELTSAPPPAGTAYGYPSPTPEERHPHA